MVKKITRLITSFTKQEIYALFKKAKSVLHEMGLEVRIAPKTFDYGRLLLVIPKTVGNAPQRNLIRRRLKHLFYQEKFYQLPYDCIILVQSEANALSYENIKKILLQGLQKSYEAA